MNTWPHFQIYLNCFGGSNRDAQIRADDRGLVTWSHVELRQVLIMLSDNLKYSKNFPHVLYVKSTVATQGYWDQINARDNTEKGNTWGRT